MLSQGGQKRAQKNHGHPAGYSPSAAIAHIRELVSDHPGFVDSPEEVEYVSEQATSLLCHSALKLSASLLS